MFLDFRRDLSIYWLLTALSAKLQLLRSMFPAGGGLALAFEWSLRVSCTMLSSNIRESLLAALHDCARDATVVALVKSEEEVVVVAVAAVVVL